MRCKNCKEEFEQYEFNNKHCKAIDCQTAKALEKLDKIKKQNKKDWTKRKREIKKELETVQDLMKKAQKVFNEFIRLRDKGTDCISCKKPLTTKFDAGHYYSSGGHKNVTFDEHNVHGQCVYCNQHLHGNLLNYQIGIAERIGAKNLIELSAKAHDTRKYTREELRDIINIYKEKIKSL
jgi:hypothetical protein